LVSVGEDATIKATKKRLLGREDRKSNRWKVPKDRQSCELKIGSKVFSASLVNESTEGFALLVDGLNNLKIGQKVEIHTYQGWCTVRIVHLNEVAPPKDVPIESESCLRLGMKKA
jgi:hypothetical protein